MHVTSHYVLNPHSLAPSELLQLRLKRNQKVPLANSWIKYVEMKANNQLAISLPVLVCQNMGRYNAKSLSTKLGLKLAGLCWTHFTTETVRRGLDFCGYSREHM